jgi:hypothetical protein
VVIQAAFNKLPRGIVRIDGGPVADSYNEIKYALNSVKPLRDMKYIETKNELAREYMNARNATERMRAVENIESELADIIALENDLTIEEAQRWYKVYGSVRRGMMDSFSQHGFWVDDANKLVRIGVRSAFVYNSSKSFDALTILVRNKYGNISRPRLINISCNFLDFKL